MDALLFAVAATACVAVLMVGPAVVGFLLGTLVERTRAATLARTYGVESLARDIEGVSK